MNATAAALPAPRLALRDGHLETGPPTGPSPVTTGLARVAAESVGLLGGQDAARLRACYAPGCVLYFIRTHPRREWCSVACGNRVRAARHYQRVRGGSAEHGPARPSRPLNAAPPALRATSHPFSIDSRLSYVRVAHRVIPVLTVWATRTLDARLGATRLWRD